MSNTMPGFAAETEFLSSRRPPRCRRAFTDLHGRRRCARIAAVEADRAAKAVMLRDDGDYLLAVIPASELLDLHKVRRVTARPRLRLATEQEMAADFPDFEVGALPPFWRPAGSSATAVTTGIRSSSTRTSGAAHPAPVAAT